MMGGNIRGGALHRTLFDEEIAIVPEGERERGRDAELLAARNELILNRYNYIARGNPGMSYEWIVKQLVRAFYLSESTIGQIIAKNGDVLHRIRKEPVDTRALKEKYVDYVWK